MQQTLTKSAVIPRTLTNGEELIVIPFKTYKILIKNAKSKKKPLPHGLQQALTEARQGKAIGPFSTVSALKKSLSS